MGAASKRVCPLEGGKRISSAQCGRTRVKGNCPASCVHYQEYLRKEAVHRAIEELDSYKNSMIYVEDYPEEMGRASDCLYIGIGEALLDDPFATDDDLLAALVDVQKHLETGEDLPGYLNRAGNLANEIVSVCKELREPPFSHSRLQVTHVVRCFYAKAVLARADDPTGGVSRGIRKDVMDLQRDFLRARGEAVDEEQEAPPQDEHGLLLPGQGASPGNVRQTTSKETTDKNDDTPALWVPGMPLPPNS